MNLVFLIIVAKFATIINLRILENPVQHGQTKHVKIYRHFIKENLDIGIMKLLYVQSKDKLLDILSKSIRRDMFKSVLTKLGIGNPTT